MNDDSLVVIVIMTMADGLQEVPEGPTGYAAPLPLTLFISEAEVDALIDSGNNHFI